MPALLPEEFRHFIKVVLAAAIRFSGFHIAIGNEEMNVNMLGVRMHREHHLVAFAVNEMLREFLRYLERKFMIHFPVVIGVK